MELKFVIIGNYGATNLGDEAILSGILELLSQITPLSNITVLSYNPGDTLQRHPGIRSKYLLPFGIRSFLRFSVFQTIQALKDADLVLIGGGGLFTDEKMKAMRLWSYHVQVASKYCKKVGLLANSIGPVATTKGKSILAKVLDRLSFITVRDTSSLQLLQEIKKDIPVNVTADPAFLLNKINVQKKKYDIAISLRPWIEYEDQTIETLVSFCNQQIEKGKNIILLPLQTFQDDDRGVLGKLYQGILNKNSVQFIQKELSLQEIMTYLGESQVLIGMRLHSLILSTMQTTPFLALGYSLKVRSLVEDLGLSDYYLDLKGLTLDILNEHFTTLDKNKAQISQTLEKQSQALQKKAQTNLEAIA